MQILFDELNKYMIPNLSTICLRYFTKFSGSKKPLDELLIFVYSENYVGVEDIINNSDCYFKQHIVDSYCKRVHLKGLKIIDKFIKDDEINWKWPYMVACHNIKGGNELKILEYLINNKKEYLDEDYLNMGYSSLCEIGYFHTIINVNEARQYFINQGATICYECCNQCPDGVIPVKNCLCCEQLHAGERTQRLLWNKNE